MSSINAYYLIGITRHIVITNITDVTFITNIVRFLVRLAPV